MNDFQGTVVDRGRVKQVGASSLERCVLAITAVVLMDAVVLLFGLAITDVAVGSRRSEPIQLTLLAFLMAQCSLGGIWWARTRWPSHMKTFVVALASAGIWALL